MSISLNTSNTSSTNIETGVALKVAKKELSQQELEGQMALNLIATAANVGESLPVIGNSGHNINIKA